MQDITPVFITIKSNQMSKIKSMYFITKKNCNEIKLIIISCENNIAKGIPALTNLNMHIFITYFYAICIFLIYF